MAWGIIVTEEDVCARERQHLCPSARTPWGEILFLKDPKTDTKAITTLEFVCIYLKGREMRMWQSWKEFGGRERMQREEELPIDWFISQQIPTITGAEVTPGLPLELWPSASHRTCWQDVRATEAGVKPGHSVMALSAPQAVFSPLYPTSIA